MSSLHNRHDFPVSSLLAYLNNLKVVKIEEQIHETRNKSSVSNDFYNAFISYFIAILSVFRCVHASLYKGLSVRRLVCPSVALAFFSLRKSSDLLSPKWGWGSRSIKTGDGDQLPPNGLARIKNRYRSYSFGGCRMDSTVT